MKFQLDTHTEITADKDMLGNWTNIAAEIKNENGTQLVDVLQVLSAIDHRHWRITGDKDISLLDLATERLALACDEQETADDRGREMAKVMLKKQEPFFDNKYAKMVFANAFGRKS